MAQSPSQPEGPFGEFTGYYAGGRSAQVVRVERIYHRNDPILGLSTCSRTSAGGEGIGRTAQQGAAEIRGSVEQAIVCLWPGRVEVRGGHAAIQCRVAFGPGLERHPARS